MAEAKAIYHHTRETWQVEKFKSLSAQQALRVFEVATPAEQRTFAPLLHKKERGQTPQFRSKALDALRSMTH